MKKLEKEGLAAQRAGVVWWNNPHESGSLAAKEWDDGHTVGRLDAIRKSTESPTGPQPSDLISRLADIRKSIEAENISYSEIYELQNIAESNPELLADDVLLREWAGLPE